MSSWGTRLMFIQLTSNSFDEGEKEPLLSTFLLIMAEAYDPDTFAIRVSCSEENSTNHNGGKDRIIDSDRYFC